MPNLATQLSRCLEQHMESHSDLLKNSDLCNQVAAGLCTT